ncbi:MAG: LLM class flavin-dependent oxidoreductase [Candidatus Binataceae bacterium]
MAQPKIIVNLYPVLPAGNEAERASRRPLGRDPILTHKIIHEMTEIAEAADGLGAWAVSTIEHHLHSEGYELAPAPGTINAYWAARLKKARIGTLGYVVGTRDPIRVAEEMAMLDHLCEGRYFAGFARGYQSRWTNILGQYVDGVATSSDGGADDRKNREIFEERVDQIIACWTQDTVSFDGKYYQAPYPYETGVVNFPAREVARRLGAPGEIDEEGVVRRVSVVPKPYQQPHPPIFTAVSSSIESIEFCSERGIVPVYFSTLDGVIKMARRYVEHGRGLGKNYAPGERQCVVRWPHFSSSASQTRQVLADYDAEFYRNIYGSFFPPLIQGATDMVDRIIETALFPCGSVDYHIDYWQSILDKVPSEYICLIWHYAQCPKSVVIAELEKFMTEVVPRLSVPDFPDAGIVTPRFEANR